MINQESDIIDMCATILSQDNIIVYPSSEFQGLQTSFSVQQMGSKKNIFVVHSPSDGYGVTISETDTFISHYKVTPELGKKIIKLYDDCEKKSKQQKGLRAQIAEQERLAQLDAAKHALLRFVSNTK